MSLKIGSFLKMPSRSHCDDDIIKEWYAGEEIKKGKRQRVLDR